MLGLFSLLNNLLLLVGWLSIYNQSMSHQKKRIWLYLIRVLELWLSLGLSSNLKHDNYLIWIKLFLWPRLISKANLRRCSTERKMQLQARILILVCFVSTQIVLHVGATDCDVSSSCIAKCKGKSFNLKRILGSKT